MMAIFILMAMIRAGGTGSPEPTEPVPWA